MSGCREKVIISCSATSYAIRILAAAVPPEHAIHVLWGQTSSVRAVSGKKYAAHYVLNDVYAPKMAV
jgi:hypothetical protein